MANRKRAPKSAATSAPVREPVHAAHLYTPETIEVLLKARALMEQAHALLDGLWEAYAIDDGSPAEQALDELATAVGWLMPEDRKTWWDRQKETPEDRLGNSRDTPS